MIRFSVQGAKGQRLLFARPRAKQTRAQLTSDIKTFLAHDNPTSLQRDFTLAGGTTVGHTVWLKLARGTYYAVVPATAAPTKKKIHSFVVAGKTFNAKRPKPTATITATHTVSWAAKPKSIARKGVLYFRNASKRTQYVDLAQLRKGKTVANARAELSKRTPNASKVFTSATFLSGTISAHGGEYESYSLPKGRYVLFCAWQESPKGKSHVQQGMIRGITLK